MQPDFDTQAPKKPTNVSVNSDLLRRARELNLNLSQILEQRLVEVIRQRRRAAWLAENHDAIETYNRRIDEEGVFSEGLRDF